MLLSSANATEAPSASAATAMRCVVLYLRFMASPFERCDRACRCRSIARPALQRRYANRNNAGFPPVASPGVTLALTRGCLAYDLPQQRIEDVRACVGYGKPVPTVRLHLRDV